MKLTTIFLIFISTAFQSCAVDILHDNDDCAYRETIEKSVGADGIKNINIEPYAGSLKISGSPDSDEIKIVGTACTARKEYLERLQLIVVREGDIVQIKTDLRNSGSGSRLDLNIEIPANMDNKQQTAAFRNTHIDMQISDTSGEVLIENITGNIYLDDGSGNIMLDKVEGNVNLVDGSGNMQVFATGGDVTVLDDGSGNIEIVGVTGNVIIEEDGSGNVTVGDVKGDFIFKRDGTGNINTWNIDGRVQLP
jgi:hypothetical protein